MKQGDDDNDSTDGLIIVAAKIRHPDVRERFWEHMEEIPGERVMSTMYEFNIHDWDEGLWDQEVQWMNDLMDETTGSIIVWRFVGDQYIRFSIGSVD